MSLEKINQVAGIITVGCVGGVTGWMSYWHIVDVVSAHNYQGLSGHLFPVLIDGTLLAASFVITPRIRQGIAVPVWAWIAVGLGITSTLTFNLCFGVTHGWASALISALVALTLLVNIELFVALLHGAKGKPAGVASADVASAVTEAPDAGERVVSRHAEKDDGEDAVSRHGGQDARASDVATRGTQGGVTQDVATVVVTVLAAQADVATPGMQGGGVQDVATPSTQGTEEVLVSRHAEEDGGEVLVSRHDDQDARASDVATPGTQGAEEVLMSRHAEDGGESVVSRHAEDGGESVVSRHAEEAEVPGAASAGAHGGGAQDVATPADTQNAGRGIVSRHGERDGRAAGRGAVSRHGDQGTSHIPDAAKKLFAERPDITAADFARELNMYSDWNAKRTAERWLKRLREVQGAECVLVAA